MAGSITRVNNFTLGLTLAQRRNGESEIGYVAVGKSRPTLIKTEYGEPLALARAAAKNWPAENGPFTLLVYLSDDAYRGTAGYKSGLSRKEHIDFIEVLAETLSSEGIDVTIREIE